MATALRFGFIFLSGLLLFMWLGNSEQDTMVSQHTAPVAVEPTPRAPYQYCELKTDLFRAQLTTRGATLKRFELLAPKYEKHGVPHDVSTTPQPGAQPGTPSEHDPNAGSDQKTGTAHEYRQQLFTQFRNVTSPNVGKEPDWNVAFDSVDWQLDPSDGSSCRFTYSSDQVLLEKVIKLTERPYELEVTTTIQNKSSATKTHAFAIDTTAWWLDEQVAASMFRVSPYVTDVECIQRDGHAVRLKPHDFEPDEVAEEPGFAATAPYGWYQVEAPIGVSAVSNAYFTHALVPLEADAAPVCQTQIERRGAASAQPGAFYRARLAYPSRSLEPGQSATYKVLSYVGPKERQILDAAGTGGQLSELIDLGFFSVIAKVLVGFLLHVYGIIPNWGVAIILLTVCARVLLFPLSIPGIRTMVKMRALKPELDALSDKYKDDMRAKGVAQMELFRKHGMSPFDQVKGCLPQLATMPVWFALYTTLQTAVELYNIPFLWFPDLSEQDPYYILPFIIGGTYYLQQRIMPFTGDPAQRKMMMYFMPAMFTVFMLFLPSGLGVYMFTNSILAIAQQYAVELHMKRQPGAVAVATVSEEPATSNKSRPKGRRT